MLKRLGEEEIKTTFPVRVGNAAFPAPFAGGLEYAAPARGTWNIVHTGMLIPEAHQIFVCAEGCLRGVVLTAAEMNETGRFSTIAVREENLLDGSMEGLMIDGVSDILNRLPKKPPAVLLYTSCIHHFMGCDLPLVYRRLRACWPEIDFTDCYMNPILRKSGLTPDQIMRKQLYSLLKPAETDPKQISIIGNDFRTERGTELSRLLSENGYTLLEIQDCARYEDYQRLAKSAVCLTTDPAAKAAGDELERRLGQKHLHLPFSFDPDEISAHYSRLCTALSISPPDWTAQKAEAEAALQRAQKRLGGTEIALDYTAFPCPLGLAVLLLESGFHVTRIYADSFCPAEKTAFDRLQKIAPELLLYPTVHTGMRVAERRTAQPVVAIGQKAAYFTGTRHFVNLVEGGGLYGFFGICRLAEELISAAEEEKEPRKLIQIKGLGCGCCL